MAAVKKERRGEEQTGFARPWARKHMELSYKQWTAGEMSDRVFLGIITGLFGWLRGKELHELLFERVKVNADRTIMTLEIVHAKTSGTDACPQEVQIHAGGGWLPDWHPLSNWGLYGQVGYRQAQLRMPFLPQQAVMSAKIKEIALRCGDDPRFYSCHSLRRGGCWAARRNGMSESAIQVFGRWKAGGDEYRKYMRIDERLAGVEAAEALVPAF
jgi:hypothetical protein